MIRKKVPNNTFVWTPISAQGMYKQKKNSAMYTTDYFFEWVAEFIALLISIVHDRAVDVGRLAN